MDKKLKGQVGGIRQMSPCNYVWNILTIAASLQKLWFKNKISHTFLLYYFYFIINNTIYNAKGL